MLLGNILRGSFMVLFGSFIGGVVYLFLPLIWIAAGIFSIAQKAAGGLAPLLESFANFGFKKLESYESERKSDKSEAIET